MQFANTFSHSVPFLFILLTRIHGAKVVISKESNLSVFPFMDYAVSFSLRTLCLDPKDFLIFFFPGSLIVLFIILKCIIYFELIFTYNVKLQSKLILFAPMSNCSSWCGHLSIVFFSFGLKSSQLLV